MRTQLNITPNEWQQLGTGGPGPDLIDVYAMHPETADENGNNMGDGIAEISFCKKGDRYANADLIIAAPFLIKAVISLMLNEGGEENAYRGIATAHDCWESEVSKKLLHSPFNCVFCKIHVGDGAKFIHDDDKINFCSWECAGKYILDTYR